MNNAADSDMYITGGAITVSEYEQNMAPDEQRRYEDILMERFQMAYAVDPYKQNLDFKHWLQTLNPELYRERAQKYDDIQAENNGLNKLAAMDPLEGALLEDAGILQRLAHLHTGTIEDLISIVEPLAQDVVPQQEGMAPGMAPPTAPSMSTPQDLFNYEGTNQELMEGLSLDPASIPKNPAQGG